MKVSAKQQIRIDVISKYMNGKLYYKDAIELLNIKERQFRRLVKSFKVNGLISVLHGNTGNSPPNKLSDKVKFQIIYLYKNRYKGLNLVHFLEKLKDHEIKIPSYGTIRSILLDEKLITPSIKKRKRCHPRRQRYEKEGLMIQIDGSHHRWITGMKAICLTLAIDDATGKLVGGIFTNTETTFAAMDVVEQILKKHGVFQMLYSDRAGIYGGGKRDGYSNMNRAMDGLGILSLQASTPQAKGRIERVFRTLQSRLVSEMRLKRINNISEANKYLVEAFIPDFNQKFGVEARLLEAGYRPLPVDVNLNEVLCMIIDRRVQAGELICYEGNKYVLNTKTSLVGKRAEIKEYRDGRTRIFVESEEKEYWLLEERKKAA